MRPDGWIVGSCHAVSPVVMKDGRASLKLMCGKYWVVGVGRAVAYAMQNLRCHQCPVKEGTPVVVCHDRQMPQQSSFLESKQSKENESKFIDPNVAYESYNAWSGLRHDMQAFCMFHTVQ